MRVTGFGLSATTVGLILRLRLAGFLCWQATVTKGGGVDVREHAAKRAGLLAAFRLTLRLPGHPRGRPPRRNRARPQPPNWQSIVCQGSRLARIGRGARSAALSREAHATKG